MPTSFEIMKNGSKSTLVRLGGLCLLELPLVGRFVPQQGEAGINITVVNRSTSLSQREIKDL